MSRGEEATRGYAAYRVYLIARCPPSTIAEVFKQHESPPYIELIGNQSELTVEDTLVDSESTDGERNEQPASGHEPFQTSGSTGTSWTALATKSTTATLSFGELYGEPLQCFSTLKRSGSGNVRALVASELCGMTKASRIAPRKLPIDLPD
jgi:hypothetical protein